MLNSCNHLPIFHARSLLCAAPISKAPSPTGQIQLLMTTQWKLPAKQLQAMQGCAVACTQPAQAPGWHAPLNDELCAGLLLRQGHNTLQGSHLRQHTAPAQEFTTSTQMSLLLRNNTSS
jgi:hypothetical protein